MTEDSENLIDIADIAVGHADGSFAAVDLGSNSFHLIVARYSHGQLTVIDRLREMVQLAAGLDERNRLDADSRQRALECLSRFGQRLRDIPPEQLRVVGTNTLRKVKDGGLFLKEACNEIGHGIDVISGIEEARLIYLGAQNSLPAVDGNLLVVDIGGGSTEVVVGDASGPLVLNSLAMGCVSFSRRFFPGGKVSHRRFNKARLAARLELRAVAARFRRYDWTLAVGTSGTARAVAAVLVEAGLAEQGISLKAMKKLMRRMVRLGHIDALDMPDLSERRAAVFPGGLAILIEVCAMLGINEMSIAEGSLREGILHDLVGRYEAHDARVATVAAMCSRYHVDTAQAERVAETAMMFFGQTEKQWGLTGDDYRNFLQWAALLHEMGIDIAHAGYQKHGAYLLAHSDMPGFTQREQKMLSCLVGLHRRKLRKELLENFDSERKQVVRMAVLLRMAVLINRSRMADEALPLQLSAKGSKVTLVYPRGWLQDNPLTRADLTAERKYLKAIGMQLRVQPVDPE